MHDGLFLVGGASGGNESYYEDARTRLLPSYNVKHQGGLYKLDAVHLTHSCLKAPGFNP
jgi:hypothetical protein